MKTNGEIDFTQKPKTHQKINGEIDFRAKPEKTNTKNTSNKELLELTKELQKVKTNIKEYKKNYEEEYAGITYKLYEKNNREFLGLLIRKTELEKKIKELKNGQNKNR